MTIHLFNLILNVTYIHTCLHHTKEGSVCFMKRAVAAALAAVMMISLTACSGGGNNEPAAADGGDTSQEEVSLRFYNYALSETAKADWWKKTVEDFEKEHENIHIETVTVDYNSMIQTFTNDLASGLAVDLVYGETSWIPALADGGFIQDPANVMDADFYAGYYDNVMDYFEYTGTVYGVPHYYTPWLIFVNKDLVEGAGLSMDDFPTTLDDLKSWIETLAAYYKDSNVTTIFGAATSEVAATGMNLNSMYTAFGGTLIEDEKTMADITSGDNKTAMTEMLDFYKYLIGNGYTQDNLKLKDYRSAFGAGNVAMYVDQSWGYAQIAEVADNTADFTVTAPLPTTMGSLGKGSAMLTSHCFLLGSNLSDAQKSAVDAFIQYCTSTEVLEGYLNEIGLAYVAHESMDDCQISPTLDGAAPACENTVQQPMTSALQSIQTELASMVLNYVQNDISADDAISSYVTEAEYYMNQ